VHHDFLDRYARLESPVHRLPAGLKLACALGALVGILLVPAEQPVLFIPFAAGLLATAVGSRVPLRFLFRRLVFMEPFVIGVAILSWFQPGGAAIFARLLIRGTLGIFTVLLLSNTTPFSELLRVLRTARVPSILVTTLALMYRYVFLLVDEAQRMSRARASRTLGRDRARAWHARATVIGQLFVRSTERAERIYAAMSARGWKT